MERCINPAVINSIANHPEVAPFIGANDPSKPIDTSMVVVNLKNYAFVTKDHDAAVVFVNAGAGLYGAHQMALPEARGRKMLRLAERALDFMFFITDAIDITAMIADGNEGAKSFAQHLKFIEQFRRENCFPLMGDQVGVTHYRMHYDTWAQNSGSAVIMADVFSEACAFLNRPHDKDNEPRNLALAAMFECAKRGNAAKGINLYNRFAMGCGFGTVKALSTEPPVLALPEGLVMVLDGRLDFLISGQ